MVPPAARALLLLFAGSIAGAQATPAGIRPGDTVRIWATNPVLSAARGVVVRQETDSVTVSIRSAVSRAWLDTPVAGANLTRLDVLEGRRRSRKRSAIGWTAGAVVGLGAGGYLAWVTGPLYCTTPCGTTTEPEFVSGVFRIGLGAVAGAAIGSAAGWWIGARPVDQWRRVR